jgi:tetratricopeptide (TPR) repeat protein
LGHYEQAASHLQEAAAISGDLGDRFIEARALGNLGLVRQHQGRYQEAADRFRQSLDVALEIGDRQGEALALARLGSVDLRLDLYEHGAAYLEQALDGFREIGDPLVRAGALNGLGMFLSRRVQPTRHASVTPPLSGSHTRPTRHAIKPAHVGQARACQADGDSLQARHPLAGSPGLPTLDAHSGA